MASATLRLLATTNNARGDLLTRVAADVFHSIGFDVTARDLAHPGREMDIEAKHRFEPNSYLVAECKSTKDEIGGADINKFVGAVDVQRRQLERVHTGQKVELKAYFVSLGGFTNAAIEQEKDLDRVVFFDGNALMQQLIAGRIVVPIDKAVDAARQQIAKSKNLTLDLTDLWVHPRGMFWAVSYIDAANGSRTIVLVHADGSPIASDLATEIRDAAIESDPALKQTTIVFPRKSADGELLEKAREAYFNYLRLTCGFIQLDGLPADEQIGSKRLALETLFVPLRLTTSPSSDEAPTIIDPAEDGLSAQIRPPLSANASELQSEHHSVGEVLNEFHRVAIVASPGAGKSTLLKRIAVAYAFPDRRQLSDDRLPDKPWFPILIRCRELGADAKKATAVILDQIGERAGIEKDLRDAFSSLTGVSLRDGTAVLLIDGLDEIADDADRAVFVKNLRTFLGTYPTVAVIITSREAGFRIVAASLASECKKYRISDLNDDEIMQLVQHWHREVYGQSDEGDRNAAALGEKIIANDRIARLAVNPLLLTTLLLVKRWVGDLPTKRSVLYEKAIEVLLMTWNIEGYEPINLDDALPRLEYVAFGMMNKGRKRIALPVLREQLHAARQDLQAELGFSKISDDEFVKRIERRSSILVLAGRAIVDGSEVPLYEFRHLTFQEYLCSRAIAFGHYPGRTDESQGLARLRPHLEDENWKEVVPLVAVLCGRGAKEIIHDLTIEPTAATALLVARCIADEVQLAPADLDTTIRWLITNWRIIPPPEVREPLLRPIAAGKFAMRFFEVAREEFLRSPALGSLDVLAGMTTIETERSPVSFDQILGRLNSTDPAEIFQGGLHAASLNPKDLAEKDLKELVRVLVDVCDRADDPLPGLAMNVLLSFYRANQWQIGPEADALISLARHWRPEKPEWQRSHATYLTCNAALVPRGQLMFTHPPDDAIFEQINAPWVSERFGTWAFQPEHAAITLRYYLRLPIDRSVLELYAQDPVLQSWAERLLEFLDAETKPATARKPRRRRPRSES